MRRWIALYLVLLLAGCSIYSEQTGWALYRMGFYDDALANWRVAAEKNDAGASFRLGSFLIDGVIVKQDLKEGVRWLKKSAKLGDRRAQMDIGSLYDRGEAGLKKSLRLAAKYYLMAARQDLPEAQYNIGVMYETGAGIDQSLTKAYMFYTLAIDNDFGTFAGTARRNISYEMSRAEIELAKMRARAFQQGKRETGLGGL